MNGGRPRILFVARAFPPTVGGMENLALQLSTHLRSHAEVHTLINHGGKKALPIFLPRSLVEAVITVRSERIDLVHLADALLAPLGAAIKLATGVRVTASVCGLDVTYPNPLYQAAIPRALRRLDLAMPISGATLRAMRDRTGDTPDARVIPLGVNPLAPPDAASVAQLARELDISDAAPVILTAGRLVRRKGVAWFAGNVLPLLRGDAIYVVVGEGPEHTAIARAAEEAKVAPRMRLLGRVPDGVLAAAYARADAFVMPNIPMAGDMEGFGLVALEAAASGLPVVAAGLEGITEAVRHGRNGLLVPPRDARAFVDQIECLLRLSPIQRRAMGARFSAYTREHYGWDSTAAHYVDAMCSVVRDGRHHHVASAAVEER